MSILTKARTLRRLGLGNIARVGVYRLMLRAGVHPCQRITATPAQGMFFDPAVLASPLPDMPKPRSSWRLGQGLRFGRPVPLPETADGSSPDWYSPPLRDVRADSDAPWWEIPDFSADLGDIKTVWESSRMDWALVLAQRARAGARTGDTSALDRLNTWLSDWSAQNLPYRGVNWKCGQEASIRVMHLAMAARILSPDGPLTPALRHLIHTHLQRIAPTMGYAIGQSNNHATSEAAALFIGGHWLGGAQGDAWAKKGRKWLENRARTLIAPDGTFSQYSATYHRLMLDTYSLAEVWRSTNDLPKFSDTLLARMMAATDWLEQLTDPDCGDGPVLGSNDGAQLIALTDLGYRDFRPSVQLASVLFRGRRAYGAGPWDEQLHWMGKGASLDRAAAPWPAPISHSFDDGGLHVLRTFKATDVMGDDDIATGAVAYLRYPRFQFRPAQADALHCDLWVAGRNILPDAGTFSYNVDGPDAAYFNGAHGHNTVTFDGRDQMPRLGRFLYGDWLRAEDVRTVETGLDGTVSAAAAYRDARGSRHARRLDLSPGRLLVTDQISGITDHAVIRWRLAPGVWTLNGTTLRGEGMTITLTSDTLLEAVHISQGWQSRYYLQKTPLPVLTATIRSAGTIITDINF